MPQLNVAVFLRSVDCFVAHKQSAHVHITSYGTLHGLAFCYLRYCLKWKNVPKEQPYLAALLGVAP